MLINTWNLAEAFLRFVSSSKVVVLDVETSGLDWRRNHIVGWVITIGPGPGDTAYVPVRHAGGGNLPHDYQVPTTAEGWDGSVHPFETILLPVLEGKTIVFHNGSFDMRFMHRIGWKSSGKIGDSMIAAYLTDELRPSLSLEACCKDEKVEAKKGEELYRAIGAKFGCAPDRSSMGHYWKMPGDEFVVHDYASGDGTSTWQLWYALQPQLIKPYYATQTREYSLEKVASVEMNLIPVLHKMSVRGIRIDEERLAEVVKITEKALADGTAKLGSDFNVKSPKAVRAYLEKNGVTNWPLTEKGAPSFPEAWLKTTPAGNDIVLVRKSRTLRDNFLIPVRDKHNFEGRIYPEFHQTRDEEFGTRTGRLSSSGPNMQAVPGKRQGDLGRLFRSIFIPDEGYTWCEADFAACEIRIAAHYCRAKVWVEGFKKGIDPHTSIADEIQINRTHAKRINLAIMTGAGKGKIALELGLPLDEGAAIVDKYFDGLPELKEFQRISTNAFRDRGFVSTLLGRRLQLDDPRFAYRAVNRLTQGGNADIIKERMVTMDAKHGHEIDIMLNVHDSMSFQYPTKSHGIKDAVVKTMTDMSVVGLSIPMQVEYGSGPDWGAATFTTEGII